jgi:hypothetical protein
MATVVPANGDRAQGGDASRQGWVEGEIRDGLRCERVRAHLLHLVDPGDPDEPHTEGEFDPLPSLPVGKAARMVLDDGRSSLIVMVSGYGRFHTVGPLA